jgi:hypothetical protein
MTNWIPSPRSRRRRLIRAGLLGSIALLALACSASGGGDGGSAGSSLPPEPTFGDHAIVTFEVADDEQFKVELTTSELVAAAASLLDGGEGPSIPIGTVVRDDPGPNAPWTWHLDPATVSFADATIEVCDGLPSDVENASITSDQYCPWSARVVALDAAP